MKVTWDRFTCSWGLTSAFTLTRNADLYWEIKWHSSGPDTIHRIIADGSSVIPVSVGLVDNKLPLLKFMGQLRVCLLRDHMSVYGVYRKPIIIHFCLQRRISADNASQYCVKLASLKEVNSERVTNCIASCQNWKFPLRLNLACPCYYWGKTLTVPEEASPVSTRELSQESPPNVIEQSTKRPKCSDLHVELPKNDDKFILVIKFWSLPLHLFGECIDWLICIYDRDLI